MDKFLWNTCFYFSPVHIFLTPGTSPLPPKPMLGINWSTFSPADCFHVISHKQHWIGWEAGVGLQNYPEYVTKSELKDKRFWIVQKNKSIYSSSVARAGIQSCHFGLSFYSSKILNAQLHINSFYSPIMLTLSLLRGSPLTSKMSGIRQSKIGKRQWYSQDWKG